MYLLCQIVVNTFADKYLHPDVSYKKSIMCMIHTNVYVG